jgi:hypothetical protein
MQKQKPIKPVQKVVQQRLPDHPPLGITVLSSLFISDVLSYSSVGWCGDESILQAQPVCLCGLGGTTSFAYGHVDQADMAKEDAIQNGLYTLNI